MYSSRTIVESCSEVLELVADTDSIEVEALKAINDIEVNKLSTVNSLKAKSYDGFNREKKYQIVKKLFYALQE